jgi:hypothetical protein
MPSLRATVFFEQLKKTAVTVNDLMPRRLRRRQGKLML